MDRPICLLKFLNVRNVGVVNPKKDNTKINLYSLNSDVHNLCFKTLNDS